MPLFLPTPCLVPIRTLRHTGRGFGGVMKGLNLLLGVGCLVVLACNGKENGASDSNPVADSGDHTDSGEPGDTGDAIQDCGTITTFEDGRSPTATLHVSPTGSDTASGTEADPLSLSAAIQNATPGVAVVVHAGTYNGGIYVSDVRGTETAPIWIGGAEGEATPVISGGNTGMQMSGLSWVVLHDLQVEGARDNGVNLDDQGSYNDETVAHHVVVRGLSISDIGGDGNQDCLKLSGVRDIWVLDSAFSRCGGGISGSGVDMVGCHRVEIARNDFSDLSANAMQAKGGTSEVDFHWNTVRDAGERGVNMGGSTDFAYFRPPLSTAKTNTEASNIRVWSNIFEGSIAAVAYVGCVDCLVANNTIVDPTNWIGRILQETTSRDGYTFAEVQNGRFVNNLVYYDRSQLSTHEDFNIGPDTQPETFEFTTNLWYAHDQPSESAPTLPVKETGGISGEDPQFVDGHHITQDSPAASAGTALDDVWGDIDGRCYGTVPSIGAHAVNE